MPIVLVFALTLFQSTSPFVGTWIADLSRSKRHPGYEFKSVTVEFAVAGNAVTITDKHVYADGKETGGVHTFEADGKERPFEAAAIGSGASWRSFRPRIFNSGTGKSI
jgi:hypothetical protein